MNAALGIIDIQKLTAPDLPTRQAEAARLRDACERHGFFYATGHGIGEDLRRESFARCRDFFSQPAAEKEKLSILKSDRFQGYEPPNSQDSKEAFVFGPERGADDPLVLAKTPYHGVNVWPQNLPGWQAHFVQLHGRLLMLTRALNRALALGFGAAEDFFDPLSDNPMSAMRLLHYPPQKELPGIAPHTDWGAFSLLFQEDVPGLEIYKDENWQEVAVLSGAMVVNIGNLIERWTNGHLTPTLHRVINKSDRDRYSMAFFLDMNHDAVITPLPSCGATRFAPITVGEYIDEMHRRDYKHVG